MPDKLTVRAKSISATKLAVNSTPLIQPLIVSTNRGAMAASSAARIAQGFLPPKPRYDFNCIAS